jgi:hypothetical protein
MDTPETQVTLSIYFILCIVYPMFFVSLEYPFLIAPSIFSNVYFVLCLVYPMLPVSLDCPFLLPLRYSLTCFCPVSCVHGRENRRGNQEWILQRHK